MYSDSEIIPGIANPANWGLPVLKKYSKFWIISLDIFVKQICKVCNGSSSWCCRCWREMERFNFLIEYKIFYECSDGLFVYVNPKPWWFLVYIEPLLNITSITTIILENFKLLQGMFGGDYINWSRNSYLPILSKDRHSLPMSESV